MSLNLVSTAPTNDETAPTILVVEDELLIRFHVVDHLQDRGFNVIEATDAVQAIKFLESGLQIDLVFTDITLPGEIDGLGLVRWIRARDAVLPVILVSGDPKVVESPREACADEPFYEKPYDLDVVVANMERLIKRHKRKTAL